MRTTIEGIDTVQAINELIQESSDPTIIGVCKNYSFGFHWLNDTFLTLEEEYMDSIRCYVLFFEDESLSDSFLGRASPATVHFVKDCEVKAKLEGTTNNRGFREKLNSILN